MLRFWLKIKKSSSISSVSDEEFVCLEFHLYGWDFLSSLEMNIYNVITRRHCGVVVSALASTVRRPWFLNPSGDICVDSSCTWVFSGHSSFFTQSKKHATCSGCTQPSPNTSWDGCTAPSP